MCNRPFLLHPPTKCTHTTCLPFPSIPSHPILSLRQDDAGADAANDPTRAPLNDRVNRWLRDTYERLTTAALDVTTDTAGAPAPAPVYAFRGNVLLLLRAADRDLDGLTAWMEQYAQDHRARQYRARKALEERDARRVRAYERFRRSVFALADGYRRPFERLHQVHGIDVYHDADGRRKRPYGPISEEPTPKLCRALINQVTRGCDMCLLGGRR